MYKFVGLLLTLVIFLTFPNSVLASGPPVQSNSRYTTPSAPVASNGTSTETVTIHLQDSDQNNVTGEVVSLSSSNDTTATFPKNDQTTDTNGDATFTVATTTPGTLKVTVTSTTSGVIFTDWFSLTFYDASKGCSSVPAAPILTSVVSAENYKVTLTWTNSASPVSNYLVSYGTISKSYIYGDTNIGAQGTTTFTIGSLTGNTKYYFAVSANNNCGTSGFSNEVTTVVKPIPSSPAPTTRATSVPSKTPSGTPVAITVSPTAMPTSLDLPTEAPATPVSKLNFTNLAISAISVGSLLIIGTFFYLKSKHG